MIVEIAKFNPDDLESLKLGIFRELAPGLTTHIFGGEKIHGFTRAN